MCPRKRVNSNSDGSGSIVVDGATLAGGAQYGDHRVHRDAGGHLYVDVGSDRMVIDGNLLIEDHQAGELGLTGMTGPVAETLPSIQTSNTLVGDLAPIEPLSYDDLGNVRVDPNVSESNREDTIYDSAFSDLINTGGGNDVVNRVRGGDDVINLGAGDDDLYTYAGVSGVIIADGGEGRDYLSGGSGRDLIEGGAGADGLSGAGGDDLIYGEEPDTRPPRQARREKPGAGAATCIPACGAGAGGRTTPSCYSGRGMTPSIRHERVIDNARKACVWNERATSRLGESR
jgi:Ca2+-binding RTX toxin-like protein